MFGYCFAEKVSAFLQEKNLIFGKPNGDVKVFILSPLNTQLK